MKFNRHHLSVLVILTTTGPAAALDDRADNPAYCYGYVAAGSPVDVAALGRAEARIRAAFAASGPKDSTDERGFEDWRRIGEAGAGEAAAGERERVLAACRRLLGVGGG